MSTLTKAELRAAADAARRWPVGVDERNWFWCLEADIFFRKTNKFVADEDQYG